MEPAFSCGIVGAVDRIGSPPVRPASAPESCRAVSASAARRTGPSARRSFHVSIPRGNAAFGCDPVSSAQVPASNTAVLGSSLALRSSFVSRDVVSSFFSGSHLYRLLDAAAAGDSEGVANEIIRAAFGGSGEGRAPRERRPAFGERGQSQGSFSRLIAALHSFFRSAAGALGRRFRVALATGLAAASLALTGFSPAAHAFHQSSQGPSGPAVELVADTKPAAPAAAKPAAAAAAKAKPAAAKPAAAAAAPAAAAAKDVGDPEGMEISKITVGFFDEAGKEKEGRTKPFVILRELRDLEVGKPLRSQNVMLALRRLHNLNIFKNVGARVRSDAAAPGKVELIVLIEEHDQTGTMNGGAGLGGSGLIGNFSVSDSNFRGRNQKVSGEVTVGGLTLAPVPGFDELLFNVSFRDPWLAPFKEKTGLEANVFNEKSTTGIFAGAKPGLTAREAEEASKVLKWRSGGNAFVSRANGDVGVAFGGSWNRVAITDPHGRVLSRDGHGHQLTYNADGQDDLVLLTVRGARETRDAPRTPSSGSVLRWQVDQSLPVGKGRLLMNRAEGKFAAYLPLPLLPLKDNPGNGQTLVVSAQGGHIQGTLPPYEAFSLGGVTTVRGYTDGEMGAGRSYALASAEYRVPVTERWGVFAFAEAATDLETAGSVPGNPAGVRGKPGKGFGIGAGIRGLTGLGPVTVQFGFKDGKGWPLVQLGLGERF
eukprot:tig00000900_g5389.t1